MLPISDNRYHHKVRVVGALVAAILLVAMLAGCSTAATPNVTVGPTVQSVSTRAASTAAAGATQAAPTAEALSTQAAPTVQSAATRAAPTVQAVATQAAPMVATVTATGPVHVVGVKVATQDSTVTLQDVSNQAINLSNWSLQVGAARTQLPPDVDIQPGQTVTVHTAAGTSNQTDIYLGQAAQAIASQLRPGVQITLENPSGSSVSSFVVPSNS